MGFYGPEPFDSAEATYVWTGLHTPGFFHVTVKGNARKFTYGLTLVRDTEFFGGLAIRVMGWTGPLAAPPATTPYTVSGNFPGTHLKEIVIIGANKTEVVPVKNVPFTNDDEFVKFASALE